MVALERIEIERVGKARLRVLLAQFLEYGIEFLDRSHVPDSRQSRDIAVLFQVPEALAHPEFLERVLARHKQGFRLAFRVQHQVTARLVYTRKVEERRFLHKAGPCLGKSLLAPRIAGHTRKNAEGIEIFEHKLPPAGINGPGIIVRRRNKHLGISFFEVFERLHV